jgi:ribulose-5-phosphate 4-epimerase/fuculose-1-phosphate aldolase
LPAAIKNKAGNANGFLMANHGIMMAGPDLRTALLRVEDYELLCRAALDADDSGFTMGLCAPRKELEL